MFRIIDHIIHNKTRLVMQENIWLDTILIDLKYHIMLLRLNT